MLIERSFSPAGASPAPVPDASRRPRAGLARRRGDGVFLSRALIAAVAGAADFAAIVAGAAAAGASYHALAYQQAGGADAFLGQGYVVAALYVSAAIARSDYSHSAVLEGFRWRRAFGAWNMAFVGALVIAFLTKTSADFSRGAGVVFYLGGFVAVAAARAIVAEIATRRARAGASPARRIFLIGYEDEVRGFADRVRAAPGGLHIVSAAILRGAGHLHEDLPLAAASARVLRPEDVFILVPWSHKETIDACVNAFLRVPSAIHLGPERILDRFEDIRIERIGPVASLHLVRKPLSGLEIGLKRVMDVTLASVALVLLAPFFAAVAIAIKLDSPGPILFFQRRYGFNQEPFRIIKFRSMTTLDDGRVIEQARPGDPRVTRMGRFMRRYNVDEWPQLVNVLRGEMSLVGPRPHALAHDQMYERTIALYARRHNVRPGITGWAQVNGLRGETSTQDKMRRRVEHDLWYIDNWSLPLDLRILLLTIVSPKAYRNAG